MTAFSRRAALLGAACVMVAACERQSSPPANGNEPEVPEPPELRSQNGVLDVTLEARPSRVTVAGQSFTSNVFNGLYIPPVLVLQRGDEARIRFVNNIAAADIEIDSPQPSNVHTHGMGITPRQPGDNAYLGIPSGEPSRARAATHHQYETPASFENGAGLRAPNIYEYRWRVPRDHPQGPHWYHPHAHGHVEPQILSGMSGLLIVDGFIADHFPELASLRVRRLLLKDIELPDAGDGSPKTKTINGVVGGALQIAPGEHQIWEIGNVGADAYFDVTIEGHDVHALSHDANILIEPQRLSNLFLPPGARSTIVIKAGAAGRYAIRSRAVDTGPAGDPNPQVELATLVVSGDSIEGSAIDRRLAQPAANRGTIQPSLEAIAALPIGRRRTMTFSETSDGNSFFINGRQFDLSRDDVTVELGDVEEWTLLNTTSERHVFHIHQLDFLVLSINDGDLDARGLRDTIDIPYARQGAPGKVVIKIPFTNPVMVGRFPFHCHIVEHEDKGMMATVRVTPPR